jgi:hypothetical protein
MRPPRTRLLALMAGVALLTAACSGAGVPTPGQHNGQSPAGGGGAAQPSGGAAQLLDQWAVCIRSHGDPNQVDPTIDANNDIQITMNNVSTELAGQVHGSAGPCSNYLLAAENALRGGQPPLSGASMTQQVKFAVCMRANGVPGWPDPSTNGTTNFNGTGVDPNSPAVQDAMKTCDKQTGQPYYPPGKEAPGVVIVTDCNAPPGKQCPAGGPQGGGSGGPIPVQSSPASS